MYDSTRPVQVSSLISSLASNITDKSGSSLVQAIPRDAGSIEGVVAQLDRGQTCLMLGGFYEVESLFVKLATNIALDGNSVLFYLQGSNLPFVPSILIEQMVEISSDQLTDGELSSDQIAKIAELSRRLSQTNFMLMSSLRTLEDTASEARIEHALERCVAGNPNHDLYCFVGWIGEWDIDCDEIEEVEVDYLSPLLDKLAILAKVYNIRMVVGAYKKLPKITGEKILRERQKKLFVPKIESVITVDGIGKGAEIKQFASRSTLSQY